MLSYPGVLAKFEHITFLLSTIYSASMAFFFTPPWYRLNLVGTLFLQGSRFAKHKSAKIMRYTDRITMEPGKRGGRPCIRGLRISVYDILEQLASGESAETILKDFPELQLEDIHAALRFAADRERHLGELNAS